MSDRPQRNPENAFRPVADEGGLVVDPVSHDVKVLNPVGSLVYRLLDGNHSVDEIVAKVTDEYDIDPSTARSHVEEFLSDLKSQGMLAAGTSAGQDEMNGRT